VHKDSLGATPFTIATRLARVPRRLDEESEARWGGGRGLLRYAVEKPGIITTITLSISMLSEEDTVKYWTRRDPVALGSKACAFP
jgi:hypothetical protein